MALWISFLLSRWSRGYFDSRTIIDIDPWKSEFMEIETISIIPNWPFDFTGAVGCVKEAAILRIVIETKLSPCPGSILGQFGLQGFGLSGEVADCGEVPQVNHQRYEREGVGEDAIAHHGHTAGRVADERKQFVAELFG